MAKRIEVPIVQQLMQYPVPVSIGRITLERGLYPTPSSDLKYVNNLCCINLNPYLHLWFSYEALVAIEVPPTGLIVRKATWSNMTYKHLAGIKSRFPPGLIYEKNVNEFLKVLDTVRYIVQEPHYDPKVVISEDLLGKAGE